MAAVVPNGRIRQVKQRYGTYALLEDGRVINDAVAGQRTVVLDGQGRNITPPPPNAWHVGASGQMTRTAAKSRVLLPSIPSVPIDRRLRLYSPFQITLTATQGSFYVWKTATVGIDNVIRRSNLLVTNNVVDAAQYGVGGALGWNEALSQFLTDLPKHYFLYTHPEQGWSTWYLFQDRPNDLAEVTAKLNQSNLFGVRLDAHTYATWNEIDGVSATSIQYRGIYRRPRTESRLTTSRWKYFDLDADYSNPPIAGVILEPYSYDTLQTDVNLQLQTVVIDDSDPNHVLAHDFPLRITWHWTFSVAFTGENGSISGEIDVMVMTQRYLHLPEWVVLINNESGFCGSKWVNNGGQFVRYDHFSFQRMTQAVETETGVQLQAEASPYLVSFAPPYYPTSVAAGFSF